MALVTFLLLLGCFMKLIIKMQGLGSICDVMLEVFSAKPDSLSHDDFDTLNAFCLKREVLQCNFAFLINLITILLFRKALSAFPLNFKVHLRLYDWMLLLKHASSGRYDLGCKHNCICEEQAI